VGKMTGYIREGWGTGEGDMDEDGGMVTYWGLGTGQFYIKLNDKRTD